MSDNRTFRCPSCGGSYFGSVLDREGNVVRRNCHSYTNAESMGAYGMLADGTYRPAGELRPCGWSGTDDECMVDPNQELE